MKMKHRLQETKEAIAAIGLDKIHQYKKELKESGKYKNFEIRLAWDVLYAAIGVVNICNWRDEVNGVDAHMETLALKACKELGIL